MDYKRRISNRSVNEIKLLAENMKNYPLKHILNGDSIWHQYVPNAIRTVFDHMNTSKFNLTITSSQLYDKDIVYNLKEKWLGIEYCERNIPEKWLKIRANAQPLAEYDLPKPNPFIIEIDSSRRQTIEYTAFFPNKILENDICVLWHLQQNFYCAICKFFFENSIAMVSAKK